MVRKPVDSKVKKPFFKNKLACILVDYEPYMRGFKEDYRQCFSKK